MKGEIPTLMWNVTLPYIQVYIWVHGCTFLAKILNDKYYVYWCVQRAGALHICMVVNS